MTELSNKIPITQYFFTEKFYFAKQNENQLTFMNYHCLGRVRSIQRPVRRKFGTAATKVETKRKEWMGQTENGREEGRQEKKNLY